jgi:hypothetical protein
MMNPALKEAVERLLPRVQTPSAYRGGERNWCELGRSPASEVKAAALLPECESP